MLAVVSITFPIFAVIAIGFLFLRAQVLGRDDLRVISNLVLNLALPALLFNAVASKSAALDLPYLGIYASGTLATLALSYVWFLVTRTGLVRASVAALGSSMPNSGLVGYPILLLAMPDLAQQVLAMNVLLENILILPLCLVLMSLDTPKGGRGVGRTIGRSILGTLKRPLMVGLLLGVAVSLAGVPVPEAITRLADLLGHAAAPLALFYIGGSLAGLTTRGNRSLAAQIVGMKLILHPAVIAGALVVAGAMGIAPTNPLGRAMILTAAVPMISSYAIFASEKGQEGVASIALIGSTVCSFFTLSFLLALLG